MVEMNSENTHEIVERYLATLDIDLDGARANLSGWDVSIAQRNGENVAIVITKGPEIHFVSLKERHAMSRRNTLQYIEPLIEKYGYATTRVPSNVTDHKLRDHLGFKQTWSDQNYIYFALTELPYQKKVAS